MIDSIRLMNIASYSGPVTVDKLKEINFFYGANGAGKTSIGRLIDNPAASIASQVVWRKGLALETLVYNNDFVEKNYVSVPDLKGVFTLGETQQAQLEQIATLKKELGSLEEGREKYQNNLVGPDKNSGKVGELTKLEAAFKDKCWAQKRKHDDLFSGAFTGARNNSDNFKSRVLAEKNSNASELVDLSTLIEKAKLLYGETPARLEKIPSLSATSLTQLETNPILKRKILGKGDVDIAAMIDKLNNSDWIRQGVVYYVKNGSYCPFCQQKTSKQFEESLHEYFDESFESDTAALGELYTSYLNATNSLNQQISHLKGIDSAFIDKQNLDANLALLESLTTINLQLIENKKFELSTEVQLKPIQQVLLEISKTINDANSKIAEQNNIVSNFKAEQVKITSQIWKYILEIELKDYIANYEKDKSSLTGAINGLTSQIEKAKTLITSKDQEIKELEGKTTSIQPTVTAINRLLTSFGFKGFSLGLSNSGDSYKLLRADGTDAKATLSEGEKTFVTFLYFYHLLKGSPTTTGMTADRVVVIDDPVSSLDSDILFIVSSLIKKLFTEIREQKGYIKQIFILTHNVYFHKEITFNHKRGAKGKCLDDESFWIVRKPSQHSKIDYYTHNPIKTSYELLWGELRKPEPQNLTIQNTLRRILENYFKILGGIDLQKLWEEFEGEDAVHCKSLISWVNDGSHFAHDDLYVVIDETMVESYLKVFFKIFKQTKHMPHYQMMMGEQYVDLDPDVQPEAEILVGISPSIQPEPLPIQKAFDQPNATSDEPESPTVNILIPTVPPIVQSPPTHSEEDLPF